MHTRLKIRLSQSLRTIHDGTKDLNYTDRIWYGDILKYAPALYIATVNARSMRKSLTSSAKRVILHSIISVNMTLQYVTEINCHNLCVVI